MQDSAQWLLVAISATLLSCIAAWAVARRYRRRMQQLMRAPAGVPLPTSRVPAPPATPAPHPSPSLRAARALSLADNRTAGLRLSALLVVTACLVSVSAAVLFCLLELPDDPFRLMRIVPIALLKLWPLVLVLALVWRWSRTRLLTTLALWLAATFAVLLALAWWRELDIGPALLARMLADEVGLPLALIGPMFLGSATRVIAPWLFLPFALLVGSSMLGLQAMQAIAQGRVAQAPAWAALLDPWLGWLPVPAVFAAFVFLPWLVAWWPARMLGRALGRAYARKRLSDLLVMFTAVWGIALTDKVIASVDEAGAAALAMYLTLAWIPAALLLAAALRRDPDRPPTLLVLRVFQQDALAQSLFDDVVERWRLSGNTVLIAGTDLADRTLDADDIFRFLDGRLAERFVGSASDLQRRLAEFDLAPDLDGRYRVNECYCHDTTWRDALRALVQRSDVVLMDLRGFQAHNAGCRYELDTLTQVERDLHVVVLTDGRTDRAAAQQAVAPGRPQRFTWIDAQAFDARTRRQILGGLFAGLGARVDAGPARPGDTTSSGAAG